MVRLATKTPGEREDEEASRLVRPAPKKKPPRRDRRRERMETTTESDPDLNGKDKSLNYKVIGGSTSRRVVARYFARTGADAPPSPPQPPRPRKKSDKIPARSRETGEKVYVTRETLKKEPGKYEKWQLKRDDGGTDKRKRKPPKPQTPAQDPAQQSEPPGKPAPTAPTEQQAPSEEPKKRKPRKRKKEKPPEAPEEEEEAAEGEGESEKPSEPEGEKPGAPPEPAPEQTPAEKHKIQPPKQREVSAAEREETTLLLVDHLPPEISAHFIASEIHPDDARTLVSSYEAVRRRAIGNPAEFATRAAEIFETNPKKVEPPSTWRADDGTKVEFAILPPDIKAAAYRQHQMQVIATSLAIRQGLEEKLGFDGAVPRDVSRMVTHALLGGLEDQEGKTAAAQVFEHTAGSKGHSKISDGLAKRMLRAVEGNEEATGMVRSFLEANDYKRAKHLYLGGRTGLTELDKPARIAEGLRAARDFFGVRAQLYGGNAHEGAKRFETRTLSGLKRAAPDKYAKVRRTLDVTDAREYERKKRPWDAYDRKLEAWERLAEGNFEKAVRKSKPEPPPGERPVEPIGYVNSKSSEDLKTEGHQLWEDIFDRAKDPKKQKKTAARIATKYLLSSYLSGLPMDQERRKRALYHGVDPAAHYPRLPYSRGEQVPIRALAETDHDAIVALAKDWMQDVSTPEQALEMALRAGPYRVDVQTFGELATRLSGSRRSASRAEGSGINPHRETDNGVRQMLRLSSEQKSAANAILGQLDSLAQSVKTNRQKWGMSFEAAKKLVNHLDRIADNTEALVFGEQSLHARQAEVAVSSRDFRRDVVDNGLVTPSQIAKAAKVIQRDADEPYMETFKNPMAPIETDADEPYMAAYGDDQSSAVYDGEDDTGRDLAP